MTIDWNDPAARIRLHGEQMARKPVATFNGHAIHKVQSRFGKLYQVGRTGTAFSAFEEAKNFAKKKAASR